MPSVTAPYIISSAYNNGPAAAPGTVRFNTSSQSLEVSDGNQWQSLAQTAHIQVSAELDQIVTWVRGEMEKSARIQQLAETSPAVQDALDTVNDAMEKLKVIAVLADKGTI